MSGAFAYVPITEPEPVLRRHATPLERWAPAVERLGGALAGRSREREARARGGELLELVQLDGHASALAGTLSGGQRKLLDLVRALMAEPPSKRKCI